MANDSLTHMSDDEWEKFIKEVKYISEHPIDYSSSKEYQTDIANWKLNYTIETLNEIIENNDDGSEYRDSVLKTLELVEKLLSNK